MDRFVTFGVQISISVIIVGVAFFLRALLEPPRSWREWMCGSVVMAAAVTTLYLIT